MVLQCRVMLVIFLLSWGQQEMRDRELARRRLETWSRLFKTCRIEDKEMFVTQIHLWRRHLHWIDANTRTYATHDALDNRDFHHDGYLQLSSCVCA